MNDDFYKEEFFYSQNGSPTEIYKYCPYHLDCNGDDYNQFALVVNCIIPYIRLAKKRGHYMSPCGMVACPDPNGSFMQSYYLLTHKTFSAGNKYPLGWCLYLAPHRDS